MNDAVMNGTAAGPAAVDAAAEAALPIEVNGEPRSVPAGYTLAALIDELSLTGQALALAVNRSVVPRQQWPQRALLAGDQVDIVRAIGGG